MKIDDIITQNEVDTKDKNTGLTPKKHIEKCFRISTYSPKSNKTIANLMREIGKGMYRSKQRIIFELLQNADDAPENNKIEFHIDTKDDYLFIMHNGSEFTKEDVDAITSAAESTKRADKGKTGYKGIGFKSVFTDSKEVWIKSGKYQFAFIRNSPKFKNYYSLYLKREEKNPDRLEEIRQDFADVEKTFDPTTDVPWQIMPIWQETLPEIFADTNFTRHDNNVLIALNIKQKEIIDQGGYISTIGDIIKKPQFILFLRNTSKFRSTKNGVTISRIDNENITTINKSSSDNENVDYKYYKKSYCDIKISDSMLKDVGILRTKENTEIGEITYFTTLSGDKIETIPSKLAEATETQISFAFIINEGKISAENAYIKNVNKYSSFFAFLPMEDTRFKLPFLVNADFIPSSDRETLQGDNLWNKYIITKIAEKHIESINNFAKEAAQEKSLYFNYLSLLLRERIPEDETANILIDIYNNTYCNLLEDTPLVVNDNNEIQLLDETILDMSDISKIFDNKLFYLITGTNKRLPHNNLNISYLEEYSYLEMEKVSLEDISKKITPEIYQRMGDYIKNFDDNKRNELIKWLDELAKLTPELVLNIPLFPYNDELKSINELSDEEDVFLVDIKTKDYSEILYKLDYEVIDVIFENEYYINVSISNLTNYINNNQLMYNRIASRCKLANLTPIEKLRLLDFFQENEFMRGIGETKYFGELKLFNDENGIARPLSDLINYDSYLDIKSLESFRINRYEYDLVYTRWGKELISSENIFKDFILNEELFIEWIGQFNENNIDNYIDDIIKIFNAKDENSEIASKKWNSIPLIFINNKERFKCCSEIYWSKSFDKVNNEDFNILVNLIQKCDERLIPHQHCGKLLDEFSLSYDSNNIDDWNNIKDINTKDANLLLDWMENDGDYGSFFDDFYFEKESDDKWNIVSNENEIRFYTSIDPQLTEYIRENCDEKFSNLQNELYGEKRGSLGVLQGDNLILEIIDSCIYNQEFASYLPKKIELDLIDKFITNLDKFELFSDNQYDQTSPEYKILYSLMYFVEDESNVTDNVEDIIEGLKSKTTVNGTPLSEFNYSDKVFIKINDKKIELSLSLILEEYKGETDILSVLIDNFDIRNKSKLRKLFFNTRILKPEEITEKINKNQSSEYLSVYQTLFRVLIRDAGYYKCKLSKEDFDEETNNTEKVQKEYLEFFDLLLNFDYYPESFYVIGDLDLFVDSSFACNSEKLPEWLFEWKNSDNSKENLLSHFGYNSKESSIVKMRQSMITDNYSEDTVIGLFNESKEQAQLLYNTLEWLSAYSTEIITKNIEIIKRICTLVELNSDTNSVTIPIINNITNNNEISYALETVETDKQLYFLREEDNDIFYNIFEAMHKTCMIINDKCGSLKKYFSNSCEIEIEDRYNEDLITKNSNLWDEDYYEKWEHYSDCPIYIYNGDKLPNILSFNDYTIMEYTDEVACQIDNCFYISKKASKNIFYNLEDLIEKDLLDDLREWHNKTIEDETLLYENHIEYNETIDRILQDRFGISKEDQKEEHNQSKVEAIYFLAEQGYDITNANDNSYSIDNILTPNGDTVKFIIRGAKGGLLLKFNL